MRITDIRLLEGDGQRVLARCSIVLDEMIAVHGLAILPGRAGGLYLAMPKFKHSDGSMRDTAHPINAETRRYLEDQVFAAYREGRVEKRPRAEPATASEY